MNVSSAFANPLQFSWNETKHSEHILLPLTQFSSQIGQHQLSPTLVEGCGLLAWSTGCFALVLHQLKTFLKMILLTNVSFKRFLLCCFWWDLCFFHSAFSLFFETPSILSRYCFWAPAGFIGWVFRRLSCGHLFMNNGNHVVSTAFVGLLNSICRSFPKDIQ